MQRVRTILARLFAPAPRCERCDKKATGVAVLVKPKRATVPGRLQTDFRTTGPALNLCPAHLEEYREDPGGFR